MNAAGPILVTSADPRPYLDAWEEVGAARLTPAERREMLHWREPRRRAAWWAARLAARRLIGRRLEEPVDALSVEILSRGAGGAGMRPVVRGRNGPLPWSLSVTHTEACVCVALACSESWEIGIDLVAEGPGTARWLEAWLTPQERSLVQQASPWTAQHLWAAKEAAYKACQWGQPFAPRQVEIEALADPWLRATCQFPEAAVRCEVHCQRRSQHVLAVAAVPRWRAGAGGFRCAALTDRQTHNEFPRIEWVEES